MADGDAKPAVCPVTGASASRAGSAQHAAGGDEQETRRRIVQRRKLDDPLYYSDYLHLGTLLKCQQPKSAEAGAPAHDEHLFIVIHQVYELWFKQMLHDLDSILDIFSQEYIPEKSIGVAVERLGRIVEIQRVLIGQLDVLETMSPMSFLDFRDFLFPASGFQSVQFRLLENKLGLTVDQRMKYGARGYCSYLNGDDAATVGATEKVPNLFDLVQRWLERTPPLTAGGFDFWSHYRGAVRDMFAEDRRSIEANTTLPAEAKAKQVQELQGQEEHFETLFDAEKHAALVKRGDRRMSHGAMQAALLIWLYQHEPLLQQPYKLLSLLLDVDEHLVRWRYRHAQMVHRMLGVKIGTGGSSGYTYLRATANRHKIFTDLFNLSTFLIPRYVLPPLPRAVALQLRFKIEPGLDDTSAAAAAAAVQAVAGGASQEAATAAAEAAVASEKQG